MCTNTNEKLTTRDAIEADHLAEDLLDAAAAIDRLASKFAKDVQEILQQQADNIKAYAKAREQDQTARH
jgi:hypothetical protein